ncbi:MAG: glycoside hydrolase family 9 protein [Fibrobacterota bacterium]|nr:MAG: glycoside hydrolase family 9 protein [Fibrobacterota bacterium]
MKLSTIRPNGLFFSFLLGLLTLSLLLPVSVSAQAVDRLPYARIAEALRDSGPTQRFRDSLTLQIGRVRVNQAGYRTMDVQVNMAKFYYMGAATAFTVFDTAGKTPAGGGALSSKGFNSGSKISIRASRWAGLVSGGDTAYMLSSDKMGTSIPKSPVQEGTLPATLQEGHSYRVVVGKDTSAAFLVSDSIYGYVRDNVLKFYGINRSGDGPSWFHAPSHLTDGQLARPSNPGAYKGGWYDCGDHLKEPQTMSYALVTLAALAATMPGHDEDKYANNHRFTVRTDGIPDILNEARFGAQFFVNSWRLNGNRTGPARAGDSGMVTGVGDFGKDHGWWGRPEAQDAMRETGRGGPSERILRSELGANVLGDVAASLAILSKRWRLYDPKWADTALMAAKDMYAWAKAHPIVVSSPAYNGAGADKVNANLALAATALLWATRDSKYLQDIAYDKTVGSHGATWNAGAGVQPMVGSWEGGWMVMSNPNLTKGGANTDWANRHSIALYTFYKLILADKDSALKYGVRDEAERQNLITHTVAGVIQNLNSISGQKTDLQIPLPKLDPNDGGGYAIRTGSDWYVMHIQQEWVWNRYQMGNTTELYFYYDIAKDLEAGLGGTNLTKFTWNREQVRQLMLRQLDYQLGVNPWDVSMLMGIGDKNFNHPHHRAANPEGRNTPGAAYGYHSPAGALYGGFNPLLTDSAYDFWNDYHHTEVCLDGAAASLSAVTGLAMEVPLNIAPQPEVKVVWVGDTSVQIEVHISKYGSLKLDLGTQRGVYTRVVKGDSVGVDFIYKIGGLTPGTQYYFDVVATDLQGNASVTDKWVNPLPDGTPFGFKTRLIKQEKADIENVKVCNVSADSAEIMWYTPNGEYQSSICWGRSPVEDTTWRCAQDIDISGHPTKFHYVKIGGLRERTDYWFRVGSDGVWDDNAGAYYRFRTPVRMANFSIQALQYTWSPNMPALAINVINNENRNYDSLSVRVYVRSVDTLKDANGVPLTHIQSTATGLVNVPLRFDQAIAARYDICQAYQPTGYNKPCDDPLWGLTWSWGTLNRGVQMLPPTKMPETCDATNTCVYYFDLPLGPTMMQQGSRIRFDVIFAARSQYSKTMSQGQLDLVNWVKVFVPSVPRYAIGDTGWFDAEAFGLTARPYGKDSTSDWSFIAHSTANGDPVDFQGIPRVQTQTQANALIDNLDPSIPFNPYMTVYRKGEFVYGFSPSKIEQATKKTSWGVQTTLQAPFDVQNGTTITLDQPSATVRVKGTADVFDKLFPASKGQITDVWVNGARLTDAQRLAAVKWNAATKLWDLDIPVKMLIGGNEVDVTIFGGGGECPDTAISCNTGCAFTNSSFFVQFTRGLLTSSDLSLRTAAGLAYPVRTSPDSLGVVIRLWDKDRSRSKTLPDTVRVRLRNPATGWNTTMLLTEIGPDTGDFQSPLLMPTAKAGALSAVELPMRRGDTIWVEYTDPDDSVDVASVFTYAEATWPQAVRAGLFRTCAGTWQLRAQFDKPFAADGLWGASTFVPANPAGDSVGVAILAGTRFVRLPQPGALAADLTPVELLGMQSGRLAIPVADGRGGWVIQTFSVADSAGPWLDSARIVENVMGTASDSVFLRVSERLRGMTAASFVFTRAGVPVVGGLDSLKPLDAQGLSWVGFARAGLLRAMDSAGLSAGSGVRDLRGNAPEECGSDRKPVLLSVRPAPFHRAWISDANGDGQADKVVAVFRKALGLTDVPDSLQVFFANPAQSRSVSLASVVVSDSVVSASLALPFPYGATSGAGVGGLGVLRVWKGGASIDYVLADSVGPALLTADLRMGATKDSLRLTFSEPMDSLAIGDWLVVKGLGSLAGAGPAVAISGGTWSLPITLGSVSAGDSVRPVNPGRWTDLYRNQPSAQHPWVPVRGAERAPLYGVFLDSDFDGFADHLDLVFAIAPKRTGSVLAPWIESNGAVTPVAFDSSAWVAPAGALRVSLPVGPFVSGASRVPSGTFGTWTSGGQALTFPVLDSLAPRLTAASLRYGSVALPDTLILSFTEPVQAGAIGDWLARQNGAAPAAFGTPVSLGGGLWALPIALGSVEVGDAVKPTPAGRWADSTGNKPSTTHPWVIVTGPERAPTSGYFLDRNGDGAADHLALAFALPPRLSATASGVWTNSDGTSVPWRVDSSAWVPNGTALQVFPIGPFAKGSTSVPAGTVGTWSSAGWKGAFPLADSLEPVMIRARLSYASASGFPDTLRVKWSEAGTWGKGEAFQWAGSKGVVTLPLPVLLLSDSAILLVNADSMGIRKGDSLRLIPSAIGVVDLSGRIAAAQSWVMIELGKRPLRLDVSMNNFIDLPAGTPLSTGGPLFLQIRPRPELGSSDTLWQRLDGIAVPLSGKTLNVLLSVNRPISGSIHIFDNSGVHVVSRTLAPLEELYPTKAFDKVKDSSGMFQIQVGWTGEDKHLRPVASGVYYMRLILKDVSDNTAVFLSNRVVPMGIHRGK